MYRPGHTNLNDFLSNYEEQLLQKTRTIVFGDTNINLLHTDSTTRRYKEMITESGYKIVNKIKPEYCTRETTTTKTIIDHISTNLKDSYFHMAIIESSLSDHKNIYLELKRTLPPKKQRVQYEATDFKKLYEIVKSSKISDIIYDYQSLEQFINKVNIETKIKRYKTINEPQKEWINRHIITGITERNELWSNLKKNPTNNQLEIDFKTKRDEICTLIKNTKDAYFYGEFTKCARKPKKIWKLINTLTNNKILTLCAPPNLISESGVVVKDPVEICEMFNTFFVNIGTQLANQIPSQFNCNNIYTLPKLHDDNRSSELSFFSLCSVQEVSKIIDNLDPNTSTGIDGISTKTLKCIKNLIICKLTDCMNQLLNEGQFPKSLKVAKVTPIHKTGDKSNPGNYRPVSVLPTLSKILEKIIYKRLDDYLTKINFIYDQQYGFRPKSNTLGATIDLISTIKTKIDQRQLALGVFIDLKKAFDTISHSLLLNKLESIGITGTVYKMLQSYLSDRYQIVKMGTHQSSPQLLTCGVPQGSILGPLLFLLYVNNIHQAGLQGHLTLYADDTCLFYFGRNINDIMKVAQDDLNILHKWFQSNLLTVNISKTSYIVFSAKNKKIQINNQLSINGEVIQRTNSEKYLGLILDSNLTWNAHLQHVKNKLSSLVGSLHKIVRCIPSKARLLIYNSLVKPHLLYLLEIWGNASKTSLKPVQILQNRIIKILHHYNYLTTTTTIYKETKLLNIKQLYTYCTCILIYKILHNHIHSQIKFEMKIKTNKYATRRASHLALPNTRTNYGKNNLTFRGAQLYNKLPKAVKEATSLNIFKKKLFIHIYNNEPLL